MSSLLSYSLAKIIFSIFILSYPNYEEIKPIGTPYKDDPLTPVFSWSKKPYTWQEIVAILHHEYEAQHLCVAPPVNVSHNVCFLVDNYRLKNTEDVKCDDMGVWINKGAPKLHFEFLTREDGTVVDVVRTDKQGKMQRDGYCLLKRTFYVNSASTDCRKVVSTLLGKQA